ncbi:hypothetical protein [Mangrovicoccus sp. HB161399]|uniref:hypothetical protein n=1 Tax=Mangrovicoccus sp. HB161399 TaxID=2720392 RepID=UPI001554E9EA|nr:hypothetical protein [Mangrovicoccus sp. HB161399]
MIRSPSIRAGAAMCALGHDRGSRRARRPRPLQHGGGRLLVFASDGLDTLPPPELQQGQRLKPAAAVEHVLEAVEARGDPRLDNVTVILFRPDPAAPGQASSWTRAGRRGFPGPLLGWTPSARQPAGLGLLALVAYFGAMLALRPAAPPPPAEAPAGQAPVAESVRGDIRSEPVPEAPRTGTCAGTAIRPAGCRRPAFSCPRSIRRARRRGAVARCARCRDSPCREPNLAG